MRIKVEVTERDIRLGKQKNCWACPIARAIDRALRLANFNRVVAEAGYLSIAICPNSQKGKAFPVNYGRVPSTAKMKWFIETFDEHGRKYVKPFSFTLNVPKSILAGAAQ